MIKDWAKELSNWGHSLIILGDFNIDGRKDKNFKAFISTGLFVLQELNDASRSIFDKMAFYDQIAWYKHNFNLTYTIGNSHDFTKIAMRSLNITLNDLSFRISDHMPLYVESGLI